uniref:Odorant receptor n=1 Tax=Heortia vitessoides TaxID=1557813 RepID=A0A978W736_9NEOP|nr:odorant receptor 41 [Heortia vitessoides]
MSIFYFGKSTDAAYLFLDMILIIFIPGMFRSYKMVSSRDIYDNLICELRGMWPQGRVSEEEHATLAPTLTRLHNVINGYFWCNVFLTVSFIAPPYIDIIKRAIGLPNPRILPFTYGLLPFDQLQPVYFEIILTLQTWQTLLTVFFIVCGDIFFCVLLSHITAQFDLLCIRITRLIFVPIDGQLIAEYPLGRTSVKLLQTNQDLASLESTLQEEIILRELKEIAERHDTLIRFSNYLERLYSFPLLVNFIYSSIIICFCAIFIVMIENITEFKYKLFLITSLSQIWVLCYYGETLPKSSRNVSTALYNCGWYNSSVKVRRSIHIMITRAQKFVYISTYGFSIICLENYTKIIKTAWSYFTILLNAYNPDIE